MSLRDDVKAVTLPFNSSYSQHDGSVLCPITPGPMGGCRDNAAVWVLVHVTRLFLDPLRDIPGPLAARFRGSGTYARSAGGVVVKKQYRAPSNPRYESTANFPLIHSIPATLTHPAHLAGGCPAPGPIVRIAPRQYSRDEPAALASR